MCTLILFITVYPIDSFQDHMTWFLYCVPNWHLSRPVDLISSLCTWLTPFKTIWPDFCIVYPIDIFQDQLTLFYHCVHNWLLSRPFDLILLLGTLLGTIKITMQKSGHMLFKGVIWVHNTKIRSNGLQRSQLGI